MNLRRVVIPAVSMCICSLLITVTAMKKIKHEKSNPFFPLILHYNLKLSAHIFRFKPVFSASPTKKKESFNQETCTESTTKDWKTRYASSRFANLKPEWFELNVLHFKHRANRTKQNCQVMSSAQTIRQGWQDHCLPLHPFMHVGRGKNHKWW